MNIETSSLLFCEPSWSVVEVMEASETVGDSEAVSLGMFPTAICTAGLACLQSAATSELHRPAALDEG